MAIHPSWQGKGLGYTLLEQSISLLENMPVQIFWKYVKATQLPLHFMKRAAFIKLISDVIIILDRMEDVNMPLSWSSLVVRISASYFAKSN